MPRHAHLILFTLWLLFFCMFSQAMVISPILALIAPELEVSVAHLGLLITAYSTTAAVGSLITGPISDRFGRRKMLLTGSALLTATLALHGFAGSFSTLLLLRALAGAATGLVNASALAFVADAFPTDRRGWAHGWVMNGVAASTLLGIPGGTLLAETWGFRAPFLAYAILTGLSGLLVWWLIPQIDTGHRGLSIRSALRTYADLLRQPRIAVPALVFFPGLCGVAFFRSYFPTWLREAHAFSGAEIAALFFVGGVGNVLAGPHAGRLSDRIGRKPVIVAAFTGVAVLFLLSPLATSPHWLFFVLFFVLLVCFGARSGPFRTLLTEMVPAAQRGALLSLTLAVGQVGLALGGGLAGEVYVRVGFWGNAIMASALTLVGIAMLLWGLSARHSSRVT